ncbi:[Fe-Fe] hydrogenase large subunit C-terminal domain-containing protein [Clostridium formicaceticum]|uniref:Periplasmic hydrogenase large subunit n=1 Tax=Clostridium formicaceticum TaxID=1497 RepID=A0AAC9RK64_9CLOT|nr:[Fe-Fe] hydrogenase large subunit C-terminal domain-containing protein [Clostridium formicaceticum]AOY76414.1 hypothetical protein BJL90_11150 [Clostridium formicaceticum]ARE86808.1 Periplasmic hydrogenase large subunit [Clostridium formicaceticum]
MKDNYELTLSEHACKDCYKCIRTCPVKAIYLKENTTEISPTRCIACGKCFTVCPQNNKEMANSFMRVKSFISNDRVLVATIDPTFVAYFGENYKKLITVLRKIGFHYIEETSVATDILLKKYNEIWRKNQQKYYITSNCSTVNLMIQKYYPELIDYMLPILPSMMIHAALLKKKYGAESKIVFFGPCIGARVEANDEYFQDLQLLDTVVSFKELKEWLTSEGITLENLEEGRFDDEGSRQSKIYSALGLSIVEEGLKGDKDFIKVHGEENTKEVLDSMREGELDPAIVEINFCLNGCIGGSTFHESSESFFSRIKQIKRYAKITGSSSYEESDELLEDYHRKFFDKRVRNILPSNLELRKILKQMGKFKKDDELNCGTCGYDTCREKAIAVYNGMDKTDMCLPYIRNKCETISNVLFEHSPNFIFLVNRNLKILSINPAAIKYLNIEKNQNNQLHLASALDYVDYLKVFETKENITGKKVYLEMQNLTVIQNLVYIEEQNAVLAVLNNITKEEQREKELIKVRQNTAEMVQKVITKQMTIAQEICSVLGETTAETKVILKRFLDLTMEKSGD